MNLRCAKLLTGDEAVHLRVPRRSSEFMATRLAVLSLVELMQLRQAGRKKRKAADECGNIFDQPTSDHVERLTHPPFSSLGTVTF